MVLLHGPPGKRRGGWNKNRGENTIENEEKRRKDEIEEEEKEENIGEYRRGERY